MRKISLAALRAHWPSASGVFLTMFLATAIVSAAAALVVSGAQAEDRFSPAATMLPALMMSFGGVAVMIAVFVVSTAVAGALRDRRREFALLRAVGADSRQVRSLVTGEVMVIAGVAVLAGSVGGYGGAYALVPLLRHSGIVADGFTPALSVWPLVASAVLLMPAAWLASRLAAREMAKLSPTAAVNSSSVDKGPLGAGRVIAAWICAAGGAAAVTIPLFVPGVVGGASGAASSLLLITAVALAGPALVARGASWAAGRGRGRRRAAPALATANARGFSRRLTAVVVPLALLVALGTIQSGTDKIVATAGQQQLGDAIGGDLVWTGSTADADAARAHLAALRGVSSTAVIRDEMVQVQFDSSDAETPIFGGLSWEPSMLRVVDQEPGQPLLDPKVTSGSLADLSQPGTVAVSSDAVFGSGKGVGDSIGIRAPEGVEGSLRIVAVYDRGLGVGPLIAGPASATLTPDAEAPATILVSASDPNEVQTQAASAGLSLLDVDRYVSTVAATQGGGDTLSTTLLFALLAFIAIAAGNALVLATRARRGEFLLLARIGATRAQLRAMLSMEAALIAVGAVGIGTLVSLPGLMTASVAMVRGFNLGLDPVLYGGLAASAIVIAFACVLGARPFSGTSDAKAAAKSSRPGGRTPRAAAANAQ